MALSAGTHLGPYEILEPLGAGGMGEVYRAHDTRLGREVAVKVLPAELSHDRDRLHRFEQEARLAGSLNHPGVLTVYDVGSHEGAPYLVTELLEGRSLREVLHSGPLPTRKAVDYAQQVAHGLAAAHARDIVHRDIKPANVFVTKDGRVKILDFGLAKLTHLPLQQAEGSEVSTKTAEGRVVGTVGYMAPEQVRGKDIDARCDIFAFGAVLYEMLSGERAFAGETTADTLTAILTKDPEEMSRPGRAVPPALDRLVRRCLEKDPEERFQSARDVAFALEAESGSSRPELDAVAAAPRHRRWLRAGLVGLTLLGAGVGIGLLAGGGIRERAPTRATFVDVALPPGVQLVEPSFARLSDDGRQIVFAGLEKGVRRLWVRSLDSPVTRPLSGTEGSAPVAWSRDGRRVAFQSPELVLKEIEVATGALRTFGVLPKLPSLGDFTGSWNAAGDLILNWGGSLLHFLASGGPAKAAAVLDEARGEGRFMAPQFLPDGRHYVVGVVAAVPERSGIYVGTLGEFDRQLVLPTVHWAAFAPQGFLLFVRDGTLFAQRFEPNRREVLGEPERLVDGVLVSTWRNTTAWAAGNTLAYVSGAPQEHQLTWLDRTGRESGRVGEPAGIVTFDLASDERRVVASMAGGLWLIDTEQGTSRRLTSGGEMDPRFSGDGKAVLFDRRSGVFRITLEGGTEEAVLEAPPSPAQGGSLAEYYVQHWSRNGRTALYSPDPNSLWAVPVSGDGPPRPVVESAGAVDEARFSPDGRWVAYNGDETGRMEVFVVPYPPTGERWQVSTAGGVQPLWRGDGRELFYLDLHGALMSVDVDATRTFSAGTPRVLFRTGLENPSHMIEDYGVTADGQRFLFRMPAEGYRPPELKLVLNWTALLEMQGPREPAP
jgi:Tol biopolymer transport system component